MTLSFVMVSIMCQRVEIKVIHKMIALDYPDKMMIKRLTHRKGGIFVTVKFLERVASFNSKGTRLY